MVLLLEVERKEVERVSRERDLWGWERDVGWW